MLSPVRRGAGSGMACMATPYQSKVKHQCQYGTASWSHINSQVNIVECTVQTSKKKFPDCKKHKY